MKVFHGGLGFRGRIAKNGSKVLAMLRVVSENISAALDPGVGLEGIEGDADYQAGRKVMENPSELVNR
jgi:hypothetical protein